MYVFVATTGMLSVRVINGTVELEMDVCCSVDVDDRTVFSTVVVVVAAVVAVVVVFTIAVIVVVVIVVVVVVAG